MTTSEILKQKNVKAFFEKINDYLIADIKRILSLPPATNGSIAYPCLQTILAGMELFGVLISGNKNEKVAFGKFWHLLEGTFPKYSEAGLQDIFRETIRNGTAHFFFPKNGIGVTARVTDKNAHLTIRPIGENKGIVISCAQLFDDFMQIYKTIKDDVTNGRITLHLEVLEHELKSSEYRVSEFINKQLSSKKTTTSDNLYSGISVNHLSPPIKSNE